MLSVRHEQNHSSSMLSCSVKGACIARALFPVTETRLATEWSGVSQDYGWQRQGGGREIAWGHAGGEAGFETVLVLHPEEGFGIVALGNRDAWPRFPFVSALAAEIRAKRTICGADPDSN